MRRQAPRHFVPQHGRGVGRRGFAIPNRAAARNQVPVSGTGAASRSKRARNAVRAASARPAISASSTASGPSSRPRSASRSGRDRDWTSRKASARASASSRLRLRFDAPGSMATLLSPPRAKVRALVSGASWATGPARWTTSSGHRSKSARVRKRVSAVPPSTGVMRAAKPISAGGPRMAAAQPFRRGSARARGRPSSPGQPRPGVAGRATSRRWPTCCPATGVSMTWGAGIAPPAPSARASIAEPARLGLPERSWWAPSASSRSLSPSCRPAMAFTSIRIRPRSGAGTPWAWRRAECVPSCARNVRTTPSATASVAGSLAPRSRAASAGSVGPIGEGATQRSAGMCGPRPCAARRRSTW